MYEPEKGDKVIRLTWEQFLKVFPETPISEENYQYYAKKLWGKIWMVKEIYQDALIRSYNCSTIVTLEHGGCIITGNPASTLKKVKSGTKC